MAPTIVRDGQFRLFFFSREETRIHVHVAHPGGEAKFWLDPAVHLAVYIGLSPTQVRQAQAVVGSSRTSRRSRMHGADTLEAEVTNISAHGFWVFLGTEELPVPYEQFPWFKKATVEQILAVERPTENHLYWPQLDVDLSVESLRRPEVFPLVSRAGA
ncbi:MAG: DUF2442 domain-containing protein [Cyanobium sp.]|nr:DUF2442 domain-containing protein [Cyanobium sp.]